MSYCLVIEYAKIANQNRLSKIGTPITGFIRDCKYPTEMEDCLKHPAPDGKPWGGLVSNFLRFQSTFKRLKKSNKVKRTFLPGNLRIPVHAEKLFGRLSRAVTWLNNRNMRKDYT